MDKKTVFWIIGAVLVGALAGFFIGRGTDDTVRVATHDSHDMAAQMGDMTANLENREGEDFERAFLEDMIVHHEGAVDMAELVLEKSDRPELVQMANGIITVQNLEVDLMQQWHEAWFSK